MIDGLKKKKVSRFVLRTNSKKHFLLYFILNYTDWHEQVGAKRKGKASSCNY